ncbi:MAG: hypothetical protein KAI57_01090 [Candidatus Pacebacteria bacterium]|nr:hypothetical protein [Candidatus Paceibacterota bacterium]
MEKKIGELNQNIKDLNVVIKRANSLHVVFLRGILWGLGSAVGATVIAVIIIAILSSIIQSVNDVPVLGNVINNLQK